MPSTTRAGAGELIHVLKSLFTTPRFTIVTPLTLALGVGTTTALFGVLHGSLESLPFPESERLTMLYLVRRDPGGSERLVAVVLRRARAAAGGLDGLRGSGRLHRLRFHPVPGGDAVHLEGEVVSASYLTVLRVDSVLGRPFLAEEERVPGAHPVVILSHDLWQGRLSGDPRVLGTPVRVDGVPMTVIGVLPEGFLGLGGRARLWAPQAMAPAVAYPGQLTDHQHFQNVVGRLAGKSSVAEAQAELEVFGTGLEEEPAGEIWSATARHLDSARVRFLVFGATVFVLLIACGNLLNLLLARGAGREREISIRIALGSSRLAIVRLLILESVAHAALGGALAFWVTNLFAALAPERLPSPANNYAQGAEFAAVEIDPTVLSFEALRAE